MKSFASSDSFVSLVRPALAACLAAGLSVALAVGGCAKNKSQTAAKSGAETGNSAAAAPSDAMAAVEAKLDFPVNHTGWSSLGYRLDWVGYPFPNGKKNRITQATAFPDCFVLQDHTSATVLLDGLNGERRWGVGLDDPLMTFVGIFRDPRDPGRVVVSSQSEGYVLSVATGALEAREKYAKVANTKPVTMGNLAIFGTATGEVLAHLMGRNVKAWGFQVNGAVDADPVLLNNGIVGIVSQAGDVAFLNGNGQIVGRNRILGPVSTNPVTDGNYLYVAGTDQSLWAFTPSGALVWRYRAAAALNLQPAVHNGAVYCFVPREGFVAFDAATGKPRWAAKNVQGDLIAVRDGKLLVHTHTGLDLLDPANGEVLQSVLMPRIVRFTTAGMEDSPIYAISDKSIVAKFVPKK